MSDLVQKFDRFKRKLNDAEAKRNKLLGQKETLMENLKEKGFNTTKKAKIYMEKREGELQDLEDQLAEDVKEFEEDYGDLL